MNDILELIKAMTIEEKASLLAGHKSWHTNKITRLGIPSIFLTDGPHGLRKKKESSKAMGLGNTELSTCFPAACTTASSWNKELLYQMGIAMGKECNYYDVNVILGPAINIKRNPLCGRNFEYFSEDPLITGALATNLTKGIEECNVATSVKHFAANNNEGNRYSGNSIVDERALREIYLKGFEKVVKEGKARTVMCAYNMVNDEFASENKKLLTDILRDEWKFDGLVMSDWGAVNDRVKGLKAGLDLEMPGDVSHNRKIIVEAYKKNELTLEEIDKAVYNVLHLIKSTLDHKKDDVDFNSHAMLAKELSLDSAVLLKNEDNALPLKQEETYLVIGELFEKMRYQGAGSSLINPYKLTTPKQAFEQEKVNFEYEQGYKLLEFEKNKKLHNKAINKAKDFETILFFAGLSEMAESEGCDRKNLCLPENQIILLEELAKLNKKIVLVLYGGSPFEIPAYDKVSGILHMYLPGEEGGMSTYELLFGKVSPSGRLAETWPINLHSIPFINEFMKTPNDLYKESIFVGYRYYNTFNVPVRFPFGYGLSYANFKYDNLKIEYQEKHLIVNVDVTNLSDIEASEVVEIFIEGVKSRVIKPARELKGFSKVSLEPHETKTATIIIPIDELKYYINNKWVLEKGIYKILVCKNVNEVILSERIFVDSNDEIEVDEATYQLYSDFTRFISMTDNEFENVIKRKINKIEFSYPYNLNTPISKFETSGGKFLYKTIKSVFKMNYKNAKRKKPTPDNETKMKNAYFGLLMLESLSLRSMSYASEGMLSHKMALGLLDIANNHVFRGLGKIIIPERCFKLPK